MVVVASVSIVSVPILPDSVLVVASHVGRFCPVMVVVTRVSIASVRVLRVRRFRPDWRGGGGG